MIKDIQDIDIIYQQEYLFWFGDWDNLIVLDGCRFDTFVENNTIPGIMKPAWSPASRTDYWLRYSIKNKKFLDTIMVSGNHFTRRFRDHFYLYYDAFNHDYDDNRMCMPPEPITNRSILMKDLFPDKRIISWYMQPHIPFIGKNPITYRELSGNKDEFITIERIVGKWGYKPEEVYISYENNLKYVLIEVERLMNTIEGKTVITADHGNSFGEYGKFGHEVQVLENIPSQRLVPWLEAF